MSSDANRPLPQPFTIAANESINPIPKLLLSFPAPRMISQIRLETTSPWEAEESAATVAASTASSPGWKSEELDRLTHGMRESAQQLLRTGSLSNFLPEQFHRESTSDAEYGSSFSSSNGPFHPTADAARRLTQDVSAAVQNMLSAVAEQQTLLPPSHLGKRSEATTMPSSVNASTKDVSAPRIPLTRVPKSEAWSHSKEAASISLPRQHAADRSGALAEKLASPPTSPPVRIATTTPSAGQRRASIQALPTTSTGGRCWTGDYKPRTSAGEGLHNAPEPSRRAIDGTAAPFLSFSDWVKRSASDCDFIATTKPSQLGRWINALPLQAHPFDNMTNEHLANFLSALVDVPPPAAASAGPGLEESEGLWPMLGWLCAQCLAHPDIPAEVISDRLMSRLLDVFARLVRGVTARLSEQPAGEFAEANFEDGDGGSRRVQRASSAVQRDREFTAAAAETTAVLPWLEMLRGYLRSFALLLCNRSMQLVCPTDVCRLEELCSQCLFRIARNSSKDLYMLYSSYVTDNAVHLYRCVWNRLEVERQGTVDVFFQHLPIASEWLTHRTYQINYNGRAVLPLTVAILAAAQSTSLRSETVGIENAETLQRQSSLWANAFVRELLLSRASDRDKGEDAATWTLALRVAEDLADLLGVPEWPCADALLRAFIFSLVQLCLGADASKSTTVEALKPLAVDVVAHVALKLFDTHQFPVPVAVLNKMELLEEMASTRNEAASLALQHLVRTPLLTFASADREMWSQLCETSKDGDAGRAAAEDSPVTELMAAVYMAESELITSPTTAADYADAWFHIRAARLMTWLAFQASDDPWIPPASLDALVRWKYPTGTVNSSTNWAEVCSWSQAVSTQCASSMLSLRMRHMLMSVLLSVLHPKVAHNATATTSDVVRRKALLHLARLTTVYPPLQRLLWPLARQCVRDDSARVRESIVPVLLTLLHDGAAGTAVDAPALEGVSAAAAASISPVLRNVTEEAISSLLHLLNDKSASVVSRSIAAIDALLTGDTYQGLFATPRGASLLSFIQYKLLLLTDADSTFLKRQQEVVRLFLHRWVVTLGDTDSSLTSAHAPLTAELVALTVMLAHVYPYEYTEKNPLVGLLQGMHAYVAAHDPAAEVPVALEVAAATRRRPRGYYIDAPRLLYIMRCAARALWTRYQCFHSTEDAVSCLSALRALAQAHSEWVHPLAEVFVQSITYPPPPTSSLAKVPEAVGGALLHICQTLYAVLQSPKVPPISLDHLSRRLTTLLSKYVGPLQQRVITAACSALCALITCGAAHRLSARVNTPYLQLCYALMNTYYIRVRELIPTLASQSLSVAYTQRFLFLLSAFLRMYPGWRRHTSLRILLGDSAATSDSAATLGALARTPGILANTYALVETVLESCGSSSTRDQLAVIALRVVASLCMLDPTTYLYRAEGLIRDSLSSSDPKLQLQGLSLLFDFLKGEDQRLREAARYATVPLNAAALILGTDGGYNSAVSSHSKGSDDEEPKGKEEDLQHRKKKKGGRQKHAAPSGSTFSLLKSVKITETPSLSNAAPSEDFNSGMSTWVFQQFHGIIAHLSCSTPDAAIRTICLRLFQQAAQGGLLPPDKYMPVVVALAADVQASLREQAVASLTSFCDRYEEVVGAAVGRGVLLAFHLHHTCGANLLRSAVLRRAPELLKTESGGVGGTAGLGEENIYSVHSSLYRLLHKRLRDSMITTLVRYLYQESKINSWCEEHKEHVYSVSDAHAPSAAGVCGLLHPVLLLCHLTLVVATLPFPHESDVAHAMHQARIGFDLNGQAALEWLMERTKAQSAARSEDPGATMKWKAVGALLLHYLRQSLAAQYRITAVKLQRHRVRHDQSGAASHSTMPLLRHDAARSAAIAHLTKKLEQLVEVLKPVLVASAEEGDADTPWEAISALLKDALMLESEDHLPSAVDLSCPAPAVRSRMGERKRWAATDKKRKAVSATQRKRSRSTSSSETTSTDDDTDSCDTTSSDTQSTQMSIESSVSSQSCAAPSPQDLP